MMRNKYTERHRKPIMGGIIRNRYLIGILACVVAYLSWFIAHATILGVIPLFSSVMLAGYCFYPLFPRQGQESKIYRALDNIHVFFFNNNLIEQDERDLNFYNSPNAELVNNSIRVYCLPSKREELLSQKTLDSMQAYLDKYDANVLIKRSYYENKFVYYELANSLDDDRIEL